MGATWQRAAQSQAGGKMKLETAREASEWP